MGIRIQSERKMETVLRLVLSLVVLTNLCQGAFTANDASTNEGGEFAQKNLNLRRQLLEEILAEIEEEELAIQRQQQQQEVDQLQHQQIEQQQRQLLLQQQQHLHDQQILNQHLQQHQQQNQHQAQQNQLRQQIQQLMVFELPQNNQLIDSLTEKMYEVVLICRNKNCAGNVDFDKKKVELTRVIEPSIELFIARMMNLVAPESLTSRE